MVYVVFALYSSVVRFNVTRRRVKSSSPDEPWRRNQSFVYSLPGDEKEKLVVCKKFYLGTLGFANDSMMRSAMGKSETPAEYQPVPDNRGKYDRPNFHNVIMSHIESFRPTISHVRREHAPLARYLPSDYTIKVMHFDFIEKNPDIKCSYQLYQQIIKKMNIRFTRLGNEECELCESFKIHMDSAGNHDQNSCEICADWNEHKAHAIEARTLYDKYADMKLNNDTLCMSADLEKVIMLPRLNQFKVAIFTRRLSIFHETFVPIGTNQKVTTYSVPWNSSIAGRGQHEIISAYYHFFMHFRDFEKIILFLDNCSSQNKSWAFYCFLTYIVNSVEVNVQEIEINYFEPGHSFMSADSFHARVEKSMKQMKNLYDFKDFQDAVQNAAKNVTVNC